MTVSRFILLIAVALSPISAWGQVTTSVRTDPTSGSVGPLSGESGANPRSGLGDSNSGVNQPRSMGTGQQSDISQGLTRPQPHYSSPIWQSTQRGGYFGMMGEIAEPGVYFHSQERVTLGEMLKLAGGATSDAGGGVRIVRQGRGGLQTFLSQDSKYELLNGDVIFLESRHRPGQPGLKKFTSKMQTVSHGEERLDGTRDTAAKKRAAAFAYLAFVNLTPEPIVVPVPGDQATLTAVMTWLRQDLKSPPFVRIISPSPQLRRDNSLPPDQQLLENGTVLVFDTATVKQDRLPEFPPVKGLGNPPPAEQAPPAIVKPPSTSQPAIPNHKPLLPLLQKPAGRATRGVLPPQAPAPPPEPKRNTVPRQGLGQQSTSGNSDGGVSNGGPVLLMPQNRGDGNSQATRPDVKSRPASRPRELDDATVQETTAASFEGQQLSWQSDPSAFAENSAGEGFEEGAVVQAHGENGLANAEIPIGPALELPRPIPNLLPEPALIASTSSQPDQTSISPPRAGSFALRIVWFSLSGLLILTVMLWWLSRGNRPHLARVRVGAVRMRAAEFDQSRASPRRSVLLSERLPIRRADTGIPQPDTQRSERSTGSQPSEVSEASAPSLPPPLRSISAREHALRAHFRQARLERGQRTIAAVDNDLPEINPVSDPETTAPPSIEPVVRPPAFQSKKPSDVLDRALHVKRGNTPTD